MDDIFKIEPTPKQTRYLASNADILLFGGGAGGGKSYTLLIDALGLCTTPNPDGTLPLSRIEMPYYNALIVRRQYKHLTELISQSQIIYKNVDPGAEWLESKMKWVFSSGATIYMLAIEDRESAEVIQGQQYQWIGLDESGQYPTDEVLWACYARLRSKEGLKCYLRLTANPTRYKWLRELFAIGGSGRDTIQTRDIKLLSGGTKRVTLQYIQSLLQDNPHLGEDYEAKLAMLGEEEKNALLLGRWDAYEKVDGSIYEADVKAMVADSRFCRVQHDKAVETYVFCDLGVRDLCVMLFIQYVGKEVHIIDMLHGNNVGFIDGWIPKIKARAKEMGYDIARLLLPHDAAAREKSSGLSIYDQVYSLMPSDVLPRLGVNDGLELAHKGFKDIWIDNRYCEPLVDNLKSYHRKYDTRLGIYTDPVHDSSSHYADCFRYIWYYTPPSKNNNYKLSSGKSLW